MKLLAFGASLILTALSFNVGAADAAGDPAKGKAKAGVCAACHGPDGNSPTPIWPKLAGQGAKYISSQVIAIRDGKTRTGAQAATMRPLVQAIPDKDINDIAAFYATQTGSIETVTIANPMATRKAVALKVVRTAASTRLRMRQKSARFVHAVALKPSPTTPSAT